MTDAEIEALIARLRLRKEFFRNGAHWLVSPNPDRACASAADALAFLLAERDRLRGAGGISKRSLHADYDRLPELLGRARSALKGDS